MVVRALVSIGECERCGAPVLFRRFENIFYTKKSGQGEKFNPPALLTLTLRQHGSPHPPVGQFEARP